MIGIQEKMNTTYNSITFNPQPGQPAVSTFTTVYRNCLQNVTSLSHDNRCTGEILELMTLFPAQHRDVYQPSAMDDGIVNQANPNQDEIIKQLYTTLNKVFIFYQLNKCTASTNKKKQLKQEYSTNCCYPDEPVLLHFTGFYPGITCIGMSQLTNQNQVPTEPCNKSNQLMVN